MCRSPTSPLALRVLCREIGSADIDRIADLLTRGLRIRTREFWVHALRRLSEHPTPPGFPKYGYLLECNGNPVGVILLIYSAIEGAGETRIRCSVSSWYTDPLYRSYATIMISRALRHKHVTYFNITPDPSTVPILEVQGYVRYCSGRFVAVPGLSLRSWGARVRAVAPDMHADEDLPSSEVDLLLKHAAYGCISVTCSSANRRHPFVFLPRHKAGLMPFAYLAYCRHLDDFVRFAGPLGRFIALRGFPLVVLDANGPIKGLIGWYSDGAPKYFKGPDQPRLGDIAHSERVVFGF
jgi:hypothetical protein